MKDWIKVSDQLPPDHQRVLAVKQLKNGTIDICIAYCIREYKYHDYETGQDKVTPYWVCGGNNNIIFWTPLPELPEVVT